MCNPPVRKVKKILLVYSLKYQWWATCQRKCWGIFCGAFCTDTKFVCRPGDEECLTSVSSSSRRVASSRSNRIRSFTMRGRGGGRGGGGGGGKTPEHTQPQSNAMRGEDEEERSVRGSEKWRKQKTVGGVWRWDDWMILDHTKHTKGKGEVRGNTEGKERIEPTHVRKYSIHSLWEQKKSMQGGTMQEQFCQSQYPHRGQRRSFIHPITHQPELLPLKLRPGSPFFGVTMEQNWIPPSICRSDWYSFTSCLPKMDFQLHLPLSPSLLAPTAMSLSPSQTPGEEI